MIWYVRIFEIKRKGGISGQIYIFRKMGSANVLGAIYQKLPIGRKITNFGRVMKENNLGSPLVKYRDMFMGRQIY